jgi:tRNA pseudouridine38-40 synthase
VIDSNVRNFKIIIEYDGSRYCGWQRQDHDPTIQETIEQALRKMTGQKISVIGSGRTDAGVHAYGQVANFKCETKLNAEITPDDIIVSCCKEVDYEFHARYKAKSKVYIYRILNRSSPAAIDRQYAWHVRNELNLEAMRAAIAYLIGKCDFKAFEGAGSPRSHTTRWVMAANLYREAEDYIILEIEADGFLRFMVRNIVGTLVDVGKGTISPDEFKHILDSKDRSRAGATAPAHGLFLNEVRY